MLTNLRNTSFQSNKMREATVSNRGRIKLSSHSGTTSRSENHSRDVLGNTGVPLGEVKNAKNVYFMGKFDISIFAFFSAQIPSCGTSIRKR